MRLAIPLALLLVAAAAPRHGCGNGGAPAYDPCAGKACGESCTACPPGSTDCMETAVVKACDPSGRCVPRSDGLCLRPSWGCVGKACGDGCGYCPPGTDPASCPVPTLVATACDAQLQCASVYDVTCSPQAACLGKACGAACETCPTCMDPVAESCDASGACVKGTVSCGQ
jgi:hypothetical protein